MLPNSRQQAIDAGAKELRRSELRVAHPPILVALGVLAARTELFAKDAEHQRSYALNLIGMATVHLLQREPEQSAARAKQAMSYARKVRSERVNTRIRKTVDTAARDFGDLAEIVDLTDQLAVDLPETAEAV